MSHSLQPVFAAAKGVDCNPRPRPPLPPDVNFLMRFSLSLAHQQNELKFVYLASKLRLLQYQLLLLLNLRQRLKMLVSEKRSSLFVQGINDKEIFL